MSATGGTGTLCSAPLVQAVPAIYIYPLSLIPWGDSGLSSPRSIPPAGRRQPSSIRHIYFCTHLYTRFPGSLHPRSVLSPHRLHSVAGGTPYSSCGAQGQDTLSPLPIPVVSTWGQSSPHSPPARAGLRAFPLPQFPCSINPGEARHALGAGGDQPPQQHCSHMGHMGCPTQGRIWGYRRELQPLKPPGGILHHPNPCKGGCQPPVPTPPAPAAPKQW